MATLSTFSTTCSCAVLRYLTDPARGITVPVAVLLWDRESGHVRFRLPEPDEAIKGVRVPSILPFVQAAKLQIESWARDGELPYSSETLEPLSDAWWEHVRKLMQFAVRLDPPQQVECARPDEEVEALFQALVQPRKR